MNCVKMSCGTMKTVEHFRSFVQGACFVEVNRKKGRKLFNLNHFSQKIVPKSSQVTDNKAE